MRWLLLILCGIYGGNAAAFDIPSAPDGYVNDYAHVLKPETVSELQALLSQEERDTSNQIYVVTLPTLDGKDISDVTFRMGQSWRVGQKLKDNGVIFAIAPADRRMRIEVGKGLEGALTDIETHVIQDEVVKPAILANHLDQGVLDGSRAIIKAVHGEFKSQAQPQTQSIGGHSWWKSAIPILLLLILFMFFPRAGMLFLMMGGGRGGFGGGGGRSDGGFTGGGGGSFGGGGSSDSW